MSAATLLRTVTDPVRRRPAVAVLVGVIAGIFSGIVKFGWEVPFPPRSPERNATNPPKALLELLGMSPEATHQTYTYLGNDLPWVSFIVHFAFAISFAVLYCVIAEYRPGITLWQGAVFGLAVWVAFHLVVMPLMGIVPAPWEQPFGEHFSEALDAKKADRGVALDYELDVAALKELVDEYKQIVLEQAGMEFPQDPRAQLDMATEAPLELVNWTDEEGSRFAPGMMGSEAFAGVRAGPHHRLHVMQPLGVHPQHPQRHANPVARMQFAQIMDMRLGREHRHGAGRPQDRRRHDRAREDGDTQRPSRGVGRGNGVLHQHFSRAGETERADLSRRLGAVRGCGAQSCALAVESGKQPAESADGQQSAGARAQAR